MTTDIHDVERQLRRELQSRAQGTRTSTCARSEILARLGRTSPSALARPRRSWRRPTLALVAATSLLVVAVWAATDEGHEPAPIPPAQPLPSRPPAVEGTVVGAVQTNPCLTDCVQGPAELDLARPAAPRMLGDATEVPWDRQILRDGRRISSDPGAGFSVVDRVSGSEIPLGPERPLSLDVLPDGRIVTVVPRSDVADAELRILDGGNPATIRLPADFQPAAVTAGPRGWIALVGSGDGECCLNKAELVLVSPDRSLHRVDIRDAVDGYYWPLNGSLALTWSTRGMIAISATALEFTDDGRERNWTAVVDPATGEQIAYLDGWQGLAWARDGTGLLVAKRTGSHAAQLRLHWGSDLESSRDLGSMSLPFTPHWWMQPRGD